MMSELGPVHFQLLLCTSLLLCLFRVITIECHLFTCLGVSQIVSELCTALSLEVYVAINVGGNSLCNVVFGSVYHIHCTCVHIGYVAVVFECCIQSCIGSTQCCKVM